MSKIFILVLLAALLIPAGAFAAYQDSPLSAMNASGGTCSMGTGNTTACGILNTGADRCSCQSGGSCDCGNDCSCGKTGGAKEASVAAYCDMMGDERGTAGTTSGGITGGVSGCGMMTSGTANNSCGNSGACDCDDACSCGMMGGSEGTAGSSCCGATGSNQGTLGTASCPMVGMMGGWGQTAAGGAGRSGWAALGFILVIILTIIWIVVGILLILNLYRKLSTK
jgi:disulfide bond formation protein DsbB